MGFFIPLVSGVGTAITIAGRVSTVAQLSLLGYAGYQAQQVLDPESARNLEGERLWRETHCKDGHFADDPRCISYNQMLALERRLYGDFDGDGIPDYLATAPADPYNRVIADQLARRRGDTAGTDPALGGAVPTDPAQEDRAAAQTAAEEPEAPSEDMEVTANRVLPTLRGFTDQTFTLMHLSNLVNLRNEPIDPEIIDLAENDPAVVGTYAALKAPLPAAYMAKSNSDSPIEANATIQCYGDPYSFFNYLTAWPGYQQYLNSSTKKISEAAAQIKIFKVFQEGKREEAVEIVFDTDGISSREVEELLKNGSKRGYGAGIKDLKITLDGTNPHTRTRSISAQLILYADSMETLLKPRKGNLASLYGLDTRHLNYRYADLALRSDTVPGSNSDRDTDGEFGMLDDLDYKLVFEVGLTKDPSANALKTGYTSVSLSLQPVVHSYQIGEDGSITLTIDYKGFVEKEFANPAIYDVFANQDSISKDLAKELGSHFLNETCGSKAVNSFTQSVTAEGASHLKERISSLMTKFRLKGHIYYIQIPEKVLHAYNTAFNSYEEAIKSATTDPDTGREKSSLSAAEKDRVTEAFKVLQEALGALAKPGKEDPELSSSALSSGHLEREAKKIEKAADDSAEQENAGALRVCAIDPNNLQVPYFYAGDLINLILENLTNVYDSNNSQQIHQKATEIVNKDPVFAEVLGSFETAAGPDGVANDILNASLGEGPSPELSEQLENAVFDTLDEIQNKYSDTVMGMNEIKDNFMARYDRFSKLRIVLGPTMINNFFTNKPIMCSIGDIPVPLHHFNSWLASEVEGKDKHRFPLNDFLDKFINQYLRAYMMGDPKQDMGVLGQLKTFTSTAVVAYNPVALSGLGVDVLTAYRQNNRRGLKYEEIPQIARPILNTTGNRIRASSIRDSYDYLVFYEKHAKPTFDMIGDNHPARKANGGLAKQLSYFGISMFQHGRDRGILKTAEYQTTNIKGLRESRFQAGKFNGLAQLTEVFDVTLNCYADLQMFNGHRLYLDPKSLVPYLSKKTLDSLNGYNLSDFGIGGFYVVNSVEHSFAQGKFETTIRAQWEQWQKNKPKKKPSTAGTVDEVYKYVSESINEPIKKACKDNSAPDLGGLSELYESAEEIARSIFGDEITDTIVGWVKGLADISENVITNVFGDDEFLPPANPNEPQVGESLNNGPTGQATNNL